MGDVGIDASVRVSCHGIAILRVHVLGVLELLIQSEGKAVFALVTDGQVWEDEVTSRAGTVQIGHASDRRAGENGEAGRGRSSGASRGNLARILERREEEEAGIVAEGDLLLALKYTQLDNWRWVDWTAVRRRWAESVRWYLCRSMRRLTFGT